MSGSAGLSFQASYDGNNRLTMVGSFVPTYDAAGNLLTDSFHTYTWNSDNKPSSVDGRTITYDAFGRDSERINAGVDNQYVYFNGQKLAVMDGSTQVRAYVPLTGGTEALYVNGALSGYLVPDWLGNLRIGATPARAYKFSQAFAPFGETYATGGSVAVNTFTGKNNDTIVDMFDFPAQTCIRRKVAGYLLTRLG